MLVPAFFMLNVYDKAIGANSLSTLAVLSLTPYLFLPIYGGITFTDADSRQQKIDK